MMINTVPIDTKNIETKIVGDMMRKASWKVHPIYETTVLRCFCSVGLLLAKLVTVRA